LLTSVLIPQYFKTKKPWDLSLPTAFYALSVIRYLKAFAWQTDATNHTQNNICLTYTSTKRVSPLINYQILILFIPSCQAVFQTKHAFVLVFKEQNIPIMKNIRLETLLFKDINR